MKILFVLLLPPEEIVHKLLAAKHKVSHAVAIQHAQYGGSDCVVITNPGLPGIEDLIKEIRTCSVGTKIIIVTADGSIEGLSSEILDHHPITCAMCALATHIKWLEEDLAKASTPLKSDEVHACG